MSDNDEKQNTINQALDQMPTERSIATAKAMLRYGVKEGDPLIEVVRIAVDADASQAAAVGAAAAAGEAATAVRSGIEKIPDQIRSSTIAAGNDLAATVGAAGKKIMEESEQRAADVTAKTEAAITKATQAGSGALRAAMQGLEAAAKSRQGQIVETWQAALSRAAEKEARSVLVRVAGWRWTQIAGALLCAMVLGAVLAGGGLIEAGKILPWGWELNPIPAAPCNLTQIARPGVGVGECAAVRG